MNNLYQEIQDWEYPILVNALSNLKRKIIDKDSEDFTGMCTIILYETDNSKHREVLYRYLKYNVPITKRTLLNRDTGRFWWRMKDKEPRIKWIDKQIKKNIKKL